MKPSKENMYTSKDMHMFSFEEIYSMEKTSSKEGMFFLEEFSSKELQEGAYALLGEDDSLHGVHRLCGVHVQLLKEEHM